MNQPLISPRKLLTALNDRIAELREPPAVTSAEQMTATANIAAAFELEQIMRAVQAGDYDESPGSDTATR